jgi:hypothetical protein
MVLLVAGLLMLPLAGAFNVLDWRWWVLMSPGWLAIFWVAWRMHAREKLLQNFQR